MDAGRNAIPVPNDSIGPQPFSPRLEIGKFDRVFWRGKGDIQFINIKAFAAWNPPPMAKNPVRESIIRFFGQILSHIEGRVCRVHPKDFSGRITVVRGTQFENQRIENFIFGFINSDQQPRSLGADLGLRAEHRSFRAFLGGFNGHKGYVQLPLGCSVLFFDKPNLSLEFLEGFARVQHVDASEDDVYGSEARHDPLGVGHKWLRLWSGLGLLCLCFGLGYWGAGFLEGRRYLWGVGCLCSALPAGVFGLGLIFSFVPR